MIKIAFFDIDGTLIDNETGKWSIKSIEGIKRLQERGILAVLCSARPYHSMKKFGVFDLDIDWDGWIGSAGAVACFKGKYLRETPLNEDDIVRFVEMVKKDGYTMELVEITERKLVFPQTDESMRFYEWYKESIPDFGQYEGETVVGINFFAPKGVEEKYRKTFPNLIIERFFETAMDVMGEPHLKSDGIKAVLEETGLKKEEAIAFGDDLQDIPMADAVGTFVCMQQGKEAVKEIATYVTDSIKNDGVYKALLHFGLIGEDDE